jgi:hypothetical protein
LCYCIIVNLQYSFAATYKPLHFPHFYAFLVVWVLP